jgi:hypothetical protein
LSLTMIEELRTNSSPRTARLKPFALSMTLTCPEKIPTDLNLL